MKKRLSERIAERTVREKPSSRSGKNRALFLALKPEIQEALNDGWPIKTIFETLFEEKQIAMTYQTFRLYVNRLILDRTNNDLVREAQIGKVEAIEARRDDPDSSTSSLKAKTAAKTAHRGGIKSFAFTPNPKKEDLF